MKQDNETYPWSWQVLVTVKERVFTSPIKVSCLHFWSSPSLSPISMPIFAYYHFLLTHFGHIVKTYGRVSRLDSFKLTSFATNYGNQRRLIFMCLQFFWKWEGFCFLHRLSDSLMSHHSTEILVPGRHLTITSFLTFLNFPLEKAVR